MTIKNMAWKVAADVVLFFVGAYVKSTYGPKLIENPYVDWNASRQK